MKRKVQEDFSEYHTRAGHVGRRIVIAEATSHDRA
jgi:hypothetical protein